ncbi:signal peptidase II [Polaromonas sp. OV174]|uniref:signal peptidase II n=1 Tax=Polaromonas sp. OV174 TaxID=1855300 RepID=UPI0008DEB61A|nr:signal peptidase II [Polaromonas sp. OV174]SFB75435.1 signal peptidase II [Polaromonas sp. OV174]
MLDQTPASAPRASPHPALNRQIALGYSIALVIFLADVATKYWVHEYTAYDWSQPLLPFFNLVQVWNQGAAFSFLADAGGWQRLFLTSVALLASVWLLLMLRKPMALWERLAYSLILGGALGNGVDRGWRGYVVDFLDFHWLGWHWPAFNIADIAIVCGALLMIFSTLKTAPAHASKTTD